MKILKPKKGETLKEYIKRVANTYSKTNCFEDFSKYVFEEDLRLKDITIFSLESPRNLTIQLCDEDYEPFDYKIPCLPYHEFFSLYFEYVLRKVNLKTKIDYYTWKNTFKLIIKKELGKKLLKREQEYLTENYKKWYFITKTLNRKYKLFKLFYLSVLKALLNHYLVEGYLNIVFKVVDFWLEVEDFVFEDFEKLMDEIIWNGKCRWILKGDE
ncbi:MAG: hypothetical protein ABGW69_03550 [Nanoarchaeota archaeon]